MKREWALNERKREREEKEEMEKDGECERGISKQAVLWWRTKLRGRRRQCPRSLEYCLSITLISRNSHVWSRWSILFRILQKFIRTHISVHGKKQWYWSHETSYEFEYIYWRLVATGTNNPGQLCVLCYNLGYSRNRSTTPSFPIKLGHRLQPRE